MLFLIAIAAISFTFLGGLLALRFQDKLHLVLGFSAGAVLGVAFFDLMPEAIELGETYGTSNIITTVAIGFLFYMLLDRIMLFHSHNDENKSHKRGLLGAGSLSFHSFLDGAAIGLAFQASASVGIVVAIAVLVHDFSDGINTVNMILKNGGKRKQAFKWLTVDAFAPALGMISTLFFTLPQGELGILLAVFCGFFLYIGASDLIPESYHRHSTIGTTIATLLGALTLYTAIQIAG